MDRWDILIIAGAGYVAVMALVRLMTARRNQLVEQVRQQVQMQRGKPPVAKPADDEPDRGAA